MCVPIRIAEGSVGVLFASAQLPREFQPAELRLLNTLAEIAGNAIHRMRLHEQTRRQVQQLEALHTIDMAINSSMDLRLTFNVLLEHLTGKLDVHAADVLLSHPSLNKLEYIASSGFRGKGITQSYVKLGEGNAGQAALTGRLVSIPDLAGAKPPFTRTDLMAGEEFVAFHAIPLIAKGKVKGVLEIFHRAPLNPDPEWLGFLETLGGQAALAIENAELYEGLHHSNSELRLAYDTTIEGWSHALDLRDKETEGHTQRVTELTIELARAIGIREKELVHIRRGALLHDIGKMGVPECILLKPGALTEDEWKVMRKHPVYAKELLSPIAYLQPALDIPYCHHEKWGGTGYPRGLKGEQIPLAARIFAVIDVWDALTSDRPYRQAWSSSKTMNYITIGASF